MSYGYRLAVLRVPNKKGKSVEFEFKSKGPFPTVKDCYIDAIDVLDSLGKASERYNWVSVFGGLLYNHIDGAVRVQKFNNLETHSEMYSYYVVIDAQDFYAKS